MSAVNMSMMMVGLVIAMICLLNANGEEEKRCKGRTFFVDLQNYRQEMITQGVTFYILLRSDEIGQDYQNIVDRRQQLTDERIHHKRTLDSLSGSDFFKKSLDSLSGNDFFKREDQKRTLDSLSGSDFFKKSLDSLSGNDFFKREEEKRTLDSLSGSDFFKKSLDSLSGNDFFKKSLDSLSGNDFFKKSLDSLSGNDFFKRHTSEQEHAIEALLRHSQHPQALYEYLRMRLHKPKTSVDADK